MVQTLSEARQNWLDSKKATNLASEERRGLRSQMQGLQAAGDDGYEDVRRKYRDSRDAEKEAKEERKAAQQNFRAMERRAGQDSSAATRSSGGLVRNLSDVRGRLDEDRYDSDPGKLLGEYLKDDNRLMQLAATEGRQLANRRGMLNSSLAAGASMDAMARAASPLALAQSEILENRNAREETALFDSVMQTQGFGFEKQLQAADFKNQQALEASRQSGQNYRAELDAETRKQLIQMEIDASAALKATELDAKDRDAAGDALTAVTGQYNDAVVRILANEDIPADERNLLVKNQGELLVRHTDMIGNLYNVPVNWSEGSFDLTEDRSSATDSDAGSGSSTTSGTPTTWSRPASAGR